MKNEKIIKVLENVEDVLFVEQISETEFEVQIDSSAEYNVKSGPFYKYTQRVYGKNNNLVDCITIKGHDFYFLSSEYCNTSIYSVRLSTLEV